MHQLCNHEGLLLVDWLVVGRYIDHDMQGQTNTIEAWVVEMSPPHGTWYSCCTPVAVSQPTLAVPTHRPKQQISCTGYIEGTGTDPMTVEVGISEIPWCMLYGMVYRKGATE